MLVGVVLRPHGLKGEVVVEVHSDRPERFAPGSELDLVEPGEVRRAVRVRRSGPGPTGLRVALEGVDDRDAAEALRGARLEVAGERVPPAPAGEFYEFELIGCRCVDRREGEVGEVAAIVESAAGPLVEVARAGGGKVLLPFVDKFLVRVDPAARIVEWDLPEGLIEACASRS